MTTEEYIDEMRSDRKPDRLYAARELRRRVRYAQRVSERRPGSLRQLEATQELFVYDQLLAPNCLTLMMEFIELRVPCAEILALLETQEGFAATEGLLALETRRWARRRLARSLESLQVGGAP